MEEIFKVLWPEEDTPSNFFDLSRRLQEARARIAGWKASSVQKGARKAWRMLQTHYPSLDIDTSPSYL